MPHMDTSLAIKQDIYQSQMMGTIQCSKCHTGTQAWLSNQANQSQMVGTIRPKCHTGTQA